MNSAIRLILLCALLISGVFSVNGMPSSRTQPEISSFVEEVLGGDSVSNNKVPEFKEHTKQESSCSGMSYVSNQSLFCIVSFREVQRGSDSVEQFWNNQIVRNELFKHMLSTRENNYQIFQNDHFIKPTHRYYIYALRRIVI